jgi:hypothetical protein
MAADTKHLIRQASVRRHSFRRKPSVVSHQQLDLFQQEKTKQTETKHSVFSVSSC